MSEEGQPPGAPPSQWKPRTDNVTRKLFDRVDGISRQVDDVHKQLEGYVTHKHLLVWACVAAVVIVGAAWTVSMSAVSEAKTAAARAADSASAAVASIEKKVDENKKAAEQAIFEQRKDSQAIYQHLLTKRRQPRLEKGPPPPPEDE